MYDNWSYLDVGRPSHPANVQFIVSDFNRVDFRVDFDQGASDVYAIKIEGRQFISLILQR